MNELPQKMPDQPGEPRAPIVAGARFSLLHLVLFTSGCCVLFAALAAMGVGWYETVIGFATIGAVSAATIGLIALGQIRVRRDRAEAKDLTPYEAEQLRILTWRSPYAGGNPFGIEPFSPQRHVGENPFRELPAAQPPTPKSE